MTEPAPIEWTTVRAGDRDLMKGVVGREVWWISPAPRDVARIRFHGFDADGTIVTSSEHFAYAESAEEALVVIDVVRRGTDHLPDWREQLEAAGFSRTHPKAADDELIAGLWDDGRENALFQLHVLEGDAPGREGEISVSATYESDGATSCHNVSMVSHGRFIPERAHGSVRVRDGAPEGLDPLKAGVAAALAIRDARQARGGAFATPLGGATRAAKRR